MAATTDTFIWKRGQSFEALCTYAPETGGPPNLTGVTITSEFRIGSNYYPCAVAITDPTHFVLTVADTSDWGVGTGYWDLRFADSSTGSVFYSETVVLTVIPQVTRA